MHRSQTTRPATSATERLARGLQRAGAVVIALGLIAFPLATFAQSPGTNAQLSGYATGTVLHADALEAMGTRLVNTEVAFSGATLDTSGDLTDPVENEMQQVVQRALEPGLAAYGRGSGLELNVAGAPGSEPDLILAGRAEAFAPPPSALVTDDVSVPAEPLAYVGLARGQAQASVPENYDVCDTLGSHMSFGLGYVADAQLLDTAIGSGPELDEPLIALSSTDPDRAVSQSSSMTMLAPQVDAAGDRLGDDFGMISQTRQTIAPVTLFKGTANELTIEILGEWVLQAVASGVPGGAFVQYGPAGAGPETPVVTIDGPGVGRVVIALQDILGPLGFPGGLQVPIPELGIEIAIAEGPREIGGPNGSEPEIAADGTFAAAALDVVRVRLLDFLPDLGRVAELRVGHMEVQASAPNGGVHCEIPVSKAPSANVVTVGEQFATTITVDNPFECPLTDVVVTDAISTTEAARFTVVDTDPETEDVPAGENLSSGAVVWDEVVGLIPPGESVDLVVTLAAGGGAGTISDQVTVLATLLCPPTSPLGATTVSGVSLADADVEGVSSPVLVVVQAPTPTPTPTPTPGPGVPTPTPGVPTPTPGVPTPTPGVPTPTPTIPIATQPPPTPTPTIPIATQPPPTPPQVLAVRQLPRTGAPAISAAYVAFGLLTMGEGLFGLGLWLGRRSRRRFDA